MQMGNVQIVCPTTMVSILQNVRSVAVRFEEYKGTGKTAQTQLDSVTVKRKFKVS